MEDRIVVANIGIRQVKGLFCLNDLHRASGGENRHRPQYWLENQQTIELIGELEADGIPSGQEKQQVIHVLNGVGTFACKELVYAYAMWISPKFNLAVIRVFDAVATGRAGVLKVPNNFEEALRTTLLMLEQNKLLEQRLEVAESKAVALDLLGDSTGAMPVSNVAKMLKQQRNKFFSELHVKGWIFRQGGVWVGKSDKVERGYLTHSYHNITHTDGSIETKTQVLITPKGVTKLAEIFGTAV